MNDMDRRTLNWPALPHAEWKNTQTTLHMWLQIVGKVRVALAPWTNQQWHTTLHITSRGLTSRPIPGGAGTVQIDFDFIDHQLLLAGSDGRTARVALEPRTVADFYHAVMAELAALGVEVEIHGSPNEVAEPIPFAENERDGSYDAAWVERYFQVLSSSARVFENFRGEFTGKCSPVHFFWGGMDLAVTRFSGRRAPEHPGGVPHLPDWVTREAYSHEVSSAGFWPGGDQHPHPFFYSYAYPTPAEFSAARVEPDTAIWHADMGEFILPWDDVRLAEDPEATLMAFLRSTYEAAADLGGWDRDALEWAEGERPPVGGF